MSEDNTGQISAAQLDESHLLHACGTTQRRDHANFYLLRLHPRTKRRLRIGRYAAIVFRHPIADHAELPDFYRPGAAGPRPADVNGYMVVHCRVGTLTDGERKTIAARTGQDAMMSAEVDQTLRNALGITWVRGSGRAIELYVYPMRPKPLLTRFFENLLGVRYLFFRVRRSLVSDIEKDLARIPEDCFPIMGLPQGASLVVERAVKRPLDKNGKIRGFKLVNYTVRAFAASEEVLARRRVREECEPARYFPSERYLYRYDFFDPAAEPGVFEESGDVPPIFADAVFRSFGVSANPGNAPLGSADPVAGRRRLVDVLVREFQDFGVALVIAILPFVQIFLPAEGGVRFDAWTLAWLSLLPALVIVMLCWRVRNQVR